MTARRDENALSHAVRRVSGQQADGADIPAGTDTPLFPDRTAGHIADLGSVLSFCRDQRPQLHVGIVPLEALQPPRGGKQHEHDRRGQRVSPSNHRGRDEHGTTTRYSIRRQASHGA